MATYREAWGLFQDESELTPINANSPGTRTGARTIIPDQSTTTTSKTELVSELRRLRQYLQELQSDSNPNQVPQMSDRPNLGPSTTQADNSESPNSPKLETFRCWEPCCKGRVFSNRSNLIRHQRERKGESAKLRCSFCDAVFLRSSARNAHEAARRCRR
ncbi:hypothetical protein BDV26DRAFT_267856 [Aspergillus bertholletiae]|uniref:C2H2-type domain-containing protein n=1 Tax=Aspergillus bertholletiae TaxID=1226010 RepID=A0A5N7B020_9EURO|nr:hypothetical protein BDV26DRAFT_267856 [Aspergillus bertholletiae]